MVKFNNDIKLAVITRLQQGETLRAISRQFKMSHPSVRDLWNLFQRTGNVENIKNWQAGQIDNPRKTDLMPGMPKGAVFVGKTLYNRSNIAKNVSVWTVQRVLRAGGLFSRFAANNPFYRSPTLLNRKCGVRIISDSMPQIGPMSYFLTNAGFR